MKEPILAVNNLKIQFKIEENWRSAVEDISFSVYPSQVVGIIGESGCGKSATAFSLLHLLPKKKARFQGEVHWKNKRIDNLKVEQIRKIRSREIGMIFQDPLSCFNPVLRIEQQLLEMWEKKDRAGARQKIMDLMKQVGLSDSNRILNSYPHQLSGGMRQRIMILMSLLFKPDLLIADEPTTALDATVQAQILYLLSKLQKQNKMSLLLITHDLGVIAQMCDFVYVMYFGKIIEQGKVEKIFSEPTHPYTKGLIDSIFSSKKGRLPFIPGNVPSLQETFSGCAFAPRCSHQKSACWQQKPPLEKRNKHQASACYFPYSSL